MSYTESDIVEGRRVLRNGAVAGYVNTPNGLKWRIVSSSKQRQHGGRVSPRTLKMKNRKRLGSPRRSNKKYKSIQKGGSVQKVSLKSAVKILRQYYSNKF